MDEDGASRALQNAYRGYKSRQQLDAEVTASASGSGWEDSSEPLPDIVAEDSPKPLPDVVLADGGSSQKIEAQEMQADNKKSRSSISGKAMAGSINNSNETETPNQTKKSKIKVSSSKNGKMNLDNSSTKISTIQENIKEKTTISSGEVSPISGSTKNGKNEDRLKEKNRSNSLSKVKRNGGFVKDSNVQVTKEQKLSQSTSSQTCSGCKNKSSVKEIQQGKKSSFNRSSKGVYPSEYYTDFPGEIVPVGELVDFYCTMIDTLGSENLPYNDCDREENMNQEDESLVNFISEVIKGLLETAADKWRTINKHSSTSVSKPVASIDALTMTNDEAPLKNSLPSSATKLPAETAEILPFSADSTVEVGVDGFTSKGNEQ